MVIIGKATKIEVVFHGNTKVDYGFDSVDWSVGTQTTRQYSLGTGNGACGYNEYSSIQSCEVQVSFSVYGGITPKIPTCPPTTCRNSDNGIVVTIVPAACVDLKPINVVLFISSYSYQKERFQVGKESWSATGFDDSMLNSYAGAYIALKPKYTIVGLAEGTMEVEDPNFNLGSPGGLSQDVIDMQALVGAEFREFDLGRMPTKSYKGSVSASNRLGDLSTTINGTFKSVGGSTFWDTGNPARMGKAQVSVTNHQVYIG